MIITTGQLRLVQLDEHSLGDRFLRQQVLLRLGTIAPENVIGLATPGLLLNPRLDRFVPRLAVA